MCDNGIPDTGCRGLLVEAQATDKKPATVVTGLNLRAQSGSYPIVATGQTTCYDNRGEIAPPKLGQLLQIHLSSQS